MSGKPLPPRPGRGAQAARLAEILRVDHAGELAAVQIYRGQRAVMSASAGQTRLAGHFAELEAQEAEHLARFDRLLTERRVRPTALAPVWRLAHRDQAVEEGAREAPGYRLLSAVIGAGCRVAIKISEKV